MRLPYHPRVQAALQNVNRQLALRQAVDGYFDTQFHASTTAANNTRSIPGSTLSHSIGADRMVAQVGLDQAWLPWGHLSAGIAERFMTNNGKSEPDYFQTLAGIQFSIPLMRNRGHRQWRFAKQQADANVKAAKAELLHVVQQLRFETDLAWIAYHQAQADVGAYQRAGMRVQTLLEETEVLVSKQAIPEYQLFPARMDSALREEELTMARQRMQSYYLQLEFLLGKNLPIEPNQEESLIAWAERNMLIEPPHPLPLDDVIMRRGDVAAQAARWESAQFAESRFRDEQRPNLHVILGSSWQVESEDHPVGRRTLTEEDTFGFEAAIVFNMPLQRRKEHAERRAARALAAEAEAHLRYHQQRYATDYEEAREALHFAVERMQLIGRAVKNAQQTLVAEEERFRLGEGRSRHVLDAQKDLTAAELRRNATAANLLRASAAHAYATAYPKGVLPKMETSHEPDMQALLKLLSIDEVVR